MTHEQWRAFLSVVEGLPNYTLDLGGDFNYDGEVWEVREHSFIYRQTYDTGGDGQITPESVDHDREISYDDLSVKVNVW